MSQAQPDVIQQGPLRLAWPLFIEWLLTVSIGMVDAMIFRTLKKQGLNVESSLVEKGERLEKLVVLAASAAVRTMPGRDRTLLMKFEQADRL